MLVQKGGYLVAPAASSLSDINQNKIYAVSNQINDDVYILPKILKV